MHLGTSTTGDQMKGPVHNLSFRIVALGAAFGWLGYVLVTSYML